MHYPANIAICKVFGFDPRHIRSLTLRLDCNAAPLIEVEYTWHYVREMELDDREILQSFTLVPIPNSDGVTDGG
jgi:hypothetical protein